MLMTLDKPNQNFYNRETVNPTAALEKIYALLKPPVQPPVRHILNEQDRLKADIANFRAKFKIFASSVSMHLPEDAHAKLCHQIDELMDFDEWEADDKVPVAQVGETYIKMLLALKLTRMPSIGMSSNGHLLAGWATGPNRLTLECMSDDRIKWVLSRKIDGTITSVAGNSPVHLLESHLAPYDPQIWFNNAQRVSARD